MALRRVWIPSPNYSSRAGSGVRLVVVHTAEGARSYRDLGNFFASSSAGVSSHVGIDDERGSIGEYVQRPDKAWTQGNYNPQCVSVELCAAPIASSYPCGANWDSAEWNRHDGMLANVAEWIREECEHYGLPITKLSSGQAQGSSKGVCGHVDLGQGGGGHWDPGPNFPWERVMDMARGGSGATSLQEADLIASSQNDGGVFHVFWVAKDGRTVPYRYQRRGETEWIDGGTLAKATQDITGLSASLTATGTLELCARYADGSPMHLWQNANSTAWSGGEPGKSKASFSPLPK